VSAIVFLVAFLVVSLLGALVLWLRDRGPRSMEAHMKAFERELHALSPDAPLEPTRRRRPDRPDNPDRPAGRPGAPGARRSAAKPKPPAPRSSPARRPPRPRPGNARPG